MFNVEEITRYDFKPSDELLLDANIWIYIQGPLQKDEKVDIYSGALSRIIAAKSRIYIDILIVSEFINTYARLKWKHLYNSFTNFKQFRKSKEFKPVAQDIAADVKRILQNCTRVANGFEELTVNTLMDEYAMGNSDFNDQILTALCKRAGLKLVTDDGDFKKQGISIITANPKLLAGS
jgi:predicted nucleic acid-binding protein